MLFFEEYKTDLGTMVLVRSSLSEENKVETLQEVANYLNPTRRVAVVVDSSHPAHNAVLYLDDYGFLSLVSRKNNEGRLEANVLCSIEDEEGAKIVTTNGTICLWNNTFGKFENDTRVSLIVSNKAQGSIVETEGCFKTDSKGCFSRSSPVREDLPYHPMLQMAFSFMINARRFEITRHTMINDLSFVIKPGFFVEGAQDEIVICVGDCIKEKELEFEESINTYARLIFRRFDIEPKFLEETLELTNDTKLTTETNKTLKMLDIFLFGLQADIDLLRFVPRTLRPVSIQEEEAAGNLWNNYFEKAAREIVEHICCKESYFVDSYFCMTTMEKELRERLFELYNTEEEDSSEEEASEEEKTKFFEEKAKELKRAFFIFDAGRASAQTILARFFELMPGKEELYLINCMTAKDEGIDQQFELQRFNLRAAYFEDNIQRVLKSIEKLHSLRGELHLFVTTPYSLSIQDIWNLVSPKDVLNLRTELINLFEGAILLLCIRPQAFFVFQDKKKGLVEDIQKIRKRLEKREEQVRSQFEDLRNMMEGM